MDHFLDHVYIDDIPMKPMVIFYSYVSLPEGTMVIYCYLTYSYKMVDKCYND